MPIIRCPECDSRVEVEPDTEGRKVICPDCDERFTVPRRSHRDDDGDRDDAPPKKKRKQRRKEPTGPNWVLIGGLVAGVVLLTVGGVVAYRMTRPKVDAPKPDTAKADQPAAGQPGPLGGVLPGVGQPTAEPPPSLPPGWVRFTAKGGIFSANLPADPSGPAESDSDMLRTQVHNLHYTVALPDRAAGLAWTCCSFRRRR
jgi:hypothetical protein